jgi:hypothetical protein
MVGRLINLLFEQTLVEPITTPGNDGTPYWAHSVAR